MASVIGELMVKIGGDINGLNQKVGQAMQAGDKVGSHFKSVGAGMVKTGALMSVAVTAPLIAFGKMGVEEMNAINAANAQTGAGIKSTGGIANVSAGQITALASAMQKKTGIDDQAVQTAENMLLTFTGVRNEVGKGNDIFNQTTQAVADMATKMNGGAVPSAEKMQSTAVMLGKAMNDPVNGMGKLTKAGVTFSDQQKKQIKTLQESGDTMGAQKIMLKELSKEFGGAAEAAGRTPAAKWAVMKDRVAGVAATVVTNLLPAFEMASEWIGRAVDKFEALNPKMQKTASIGIAVAAAIGPVLIIMGTLVSSMGTLIGAASKLAPLLMGVSLPVLAIAAAALLVIAPFAYMAAQFAKTEDGAATLKYALDQVKRVIKAFADAAKQALGAFSDSFKKAFNPGGAKADGEKIRGVIKSIADAAIAAAPYIVKIASALGTAFGTGASFVIQAGTKIAEGIRAVIDAFVKMWNKNDELRANVMNVWNQIKLTVTQVLSGLVATLTTWAGWARALWAAHGEAIMAYIGRAMSNLMQIIGGALQVIRGIITTVLAVLRGDWKGAWDGIKTILSGVWNIIKGIVSQAINVVKASLSVAWTAIKAAAKASWNDFKESILKTWNDIKSAVSSKLASITADISGKWNAIKAQTSAAWDAIKGAITSAWGAIKGAVTSGINAARGVITGGWNAIKGATESAWNTIKGAVSSGLSKIGSAITGAIGTMVAGINSVWNGVKAATAAGWILVKTAVTTGLSDVASAITGKISDFTSKGKDIANGIVDGVANGIASAGGAITSAIVNACSSALKAALKTLGIKSPSTVFRDKVGKMISAGIAVGIHAGGEAAANAARAIADRLLALSAKAAAKAKAMADKAKKHAKQFGAEAKKATAAADKAVNAYNKANAAAKKLENAEAARDKRLQTILDTGDLAQSKIDLQLSIGGIEQVTALTRGIENAQTEFAALSTFYDANRTQLNAGDTTAIIDKMTELSDFINESTAGIADIGAEATQKTIDAAADAFQSLMSSFDAEEVQLRIRLNGADDLNAQVAQATSELGRLQAYSGVLSAEDAASRQSAIADLVEQIAGFKKQITEASAPATETESTPVTGTDTASGTPVANSGSGGGSPSGSSSGDLNINVKITANGIERSVADAVGDEMVMRLRTMGYRL